MIAILADDLSGAAELAALAASAGLSSEVQTAFDPSTDADVVAVDTDSRAVDETEAVARVRQTAAQVVSAGPDWIYKKTDSVLRGHVAAECEAVAAVAGKSRILLVPANPARRRTLREGVYRVDGVPLDQGPFADDPQWPARNAGILRLLAGASCAVHSLREHEPARPDGLNVPDIWQPSQLRQRAGEMNDQTLAAGAAEFFQALLPPERKRPPLTPVPDALSPLTLIVCGSHAAWAGSRLRECQQRAIPIVPMPRRLFAEDHSDREIDAWAVELEDAMAINGSAMIAVGGEKIAGLAPGVLERRLAEAVRRVLQRVVVGHLLLEGGATAAAVLHRCEWHRLRVGPEVAPGLAWLDVIGAPAPRLLVKPGSYAWPDAAWPA
jgi:uncharacterized protein YgbK (DUF1537 family)